jgi:hypothetical protein
MSPFQRPQYWAWIRSQAELLGSDGCTVVSGLQIDCCFEHDLGYYYAKDPRDAYLRELTGSLDPWTAAKAIDRDTVDARFRRCHQNRSLFGTYSPMAFWRWLGVRFGGQKRWDRHREREAADDSKAA